jgi:ribosomal protein S18 acetylase RimI-like enzyme
MIKEAYIRPAVKNDLAQVLSLYAQPELDDGRVLPMDRAEAIFERMQAYPHYKLYVAEAGQKILGVFALLIMDNLGHLGAPSAIIEHVAVAPECQGQSIGTQMMKFAMAECRKAGCYKIALSSNKKRIQAHRFYEKLGFVQHGYSFVVEGNNEDKGI